MRISFLPFSVSILILLLFAAQSVHSLNSEKITTEIGTSYNISFIQRTILEPDRTYNFHHIFQVIEFGGNLTSIANFSIGIILTDNLGINSTSYSFTYGELNNETTGTSDQFVFDYQYTVNKYDISPSSISQFFQLNFTEGELKYSSPIIKLTQFSVKIVHRDDESSNRGSYWYLLLLLAIPIVKKIKL